jgi:hypothetical protein
LIKVNYILKWNKINLKAIIIIDYNCLQFHLLFIHAVTHLLETKKSETRKRKSKIVHKKTSIFWFLPQQVTCYFLTGLTGWDILHINCMYKEGEGE